MFNGKYMYSENFNGLPVFKKDGNPLIKIWNENDVWYFTFKQTNYYSSDSYIYVVCLFSLLFYFCFYVLGLFCFES